MDAASKYVVFKVDCDGGRLGKVWEMKLCETKEVADRKIAQFTEPIKYLNGVEYFKEDKIEDKFGLVCWKSGIFVYCETYWVYRA